MNEKRPQLNPQQVQRLIEFDPIYAALLDTYHDLRKEVEHVRIMLAEKENSFRKYEREKKDEDQLKTLENQLSEALRIRSETPKPSLKETATRMGITNNRIARLSRYAYYRKNLAL